MLARAVTVLVLCLSNIMLGVIVSDFDYFYARLINENNTIVEQCFVIAFIILLTIYSLFFTAVLILAPEKVGEILD